MIQVGADNKLRRSLEAKLAELQGSLAKHDKTALERKFSVRYHKVFAHVLIGTLSTQQIQQNTPNGSDTLSATDPIL